MDNESQEKGIILLVDDTPSNLSVLFDSLSNSGFKILVALDGESAIEQVDYVVPDLILLDVLMPGIDGFETCRRLKKKVSTQEIPIIFMTALTETVDKVKGFSVGAVDYVTKPIQTEEVLARVNTHLALQNLKKVLLKQNEQLQQEICDREAAARQRQKAEEALRLLLHSVSHDLRNPVTGMSMVLRNLLAQKQDTIPVSRSILERMAASSDRQLNLINSLVDAHASEIGDGVAFRQPLQLSQLIQDLVADWEPIFVQSQATLTNLVPSTLPLVNADVTQLWRVFENLIGNALKHNPPGVNLTITATVEAMLQNSEQENAIATCSNEVSSSSPYSRLHTHQKKLCSSPAVIRCAIQDNGVGIEPQYCKQLFELYVRGNPSRHTTGLGLGLYLCRQIITAHGGEIAVSSTPGNGATFWFTLPLLECV